MRLADVLPVLEAIAPPRLAAAWDNVGLLVEGERPVRRLFACVDLTEAVLAEALAGEADLLLAYHPPLFAPVKRLTAATPGGRVLLAAARAGVHVWSPHTALDAAAGGMADWLLEAVGPVVGAAPLAPDRDEPAVGAGRRAALAAPRRLSAVVADVKRHLGLDHLRVAAPVDDPEVRTVAVCPGAGGSLFEGVAADLFLTGELRHHDVLAHVAAGASVILGEHTNTERGYLPRLAARLAAALPGADVRCSRVDADPLRVR